MINNHGVVDWVNLLSPIEPNLVGPIIPRFVNLDEHAINECNATLEFLQICAQHNLLLCCGPLNLISNCIINAWCNEDGIITNCTLWWIPYKCIIHGNIIMFHIYKMNCKRPCSMVNFERCPIWMWWSHVSSNY